jgi:hypothetical protein
MGKFKDLDLENVLEEDVWWFVRTVAENSEGYDIYLGGGMLRDLYTGNTPKDVDIFAIPKFEYEGQRELYVPPRGYNNYIKHARDISDMQDRGVEKVRGDWYSKMSTPDVQFIIYEKHLTQEELAEDFDMNICQIVMNGLTGSTYATNAFLQGHEGMVIECLHDYDRIRTYKRYVRMEAKFYNYGVEGKPELEHHEVVELASHVDHEGSFCGEADEFDTEIEYQEGGCKW